ncbi:hypothetical protein [Aliikangiella maris]|uniref:Uncharacterized protein n=2 Tax=Aliikangiella maris TaxID=3162458 RepID=A0ABV3MPT9_9GAMM
MNFTIILSITIILIGCVAVITFIQKREEQKAALRQRISQYRYRANQASTILSNISHLPVGPETRKILIQYTLANLKAIQHLVPDDSTNNRNIDILKENLNQPASPVDSQSLNIPSDLEQLKVQINQLSKLAKYILKVRKTSGGLSGLVPQAINRIMGLISESKICAYIQQGKDSLAKHEYVQAQREFSTAQVMMAKVTNKNERLKKLEKDLLELIMSTPQKAFNTELSFDDAPKQEPTEVSQDEAPDDTLFGPKKKW